MMTYFSIEYGIIPVVITLSIAHGIGFTLIYAQTVGSVIKWFIGNRSGKKNLKWRLKHMVSPNIMFWICRLYVKYCFEWIWFWSSHMDSN